MKKIYINPTMKVVELKRRQHLLAGSDLETRKGHATEWGAHEMNDYDDFDE